MSPRSDARRVALTAVWFGLATAGLARPSWAAPDAPTETASDAEPEGQPRDEPQPIEIRVEGERSLAGSPRDRAAAATVIPRSALERPGASAADVLGDAPGVETRRTGADSDLSTASLRGATAAQTPVYLGGVRLNDEVSGTADLSTVPLFLLHRVEVFRGSAPAEADRLGLGGAIFFEPVLPRGPELRAGQLVGSHGASSTWLAAAHGDERASASVALRRDAAENDYSFVNDGGTRFDARDDREVTRQNAAHTTWELWAIGRYRLGPRGRALLLTHDFSREQGVTGLSVLPAERSRARSERRLVALSTSVPCARAAADGREPCRLELVTSALAAATSLADPARELALGATQVSSEGRRWTELVRWRQELAPGVAFTASGEQSVELLTVRRPLAGGSRFSLAARRHVTRPAASVTLGRANRLQWLGLAALECHSTAGPKGSGTCDELEPVARSGLLVRPAPFLELVGNVGRAARVPTLGELYGVAPLVRGNPALEPERGTTLDAGLRLSGERARSKLAGSFEAFAFHRRVVDLVSYRQSFRQLVPYNLGAARVRGLELAGELRYQRALRLGAVATLQDPRDVSPGRTLENDILPLHSRLVVVQYLEAGLRPGLTGLDRLAAAARLRHRSSRYQDPAGLVIVPHATTLELEATAALLGERLMLRGAVENVLDQPEWDLIGLPLPGRTLSAALELVVP